MAIEWRPMQTAPTDGSRVLLLCPDARRQDGRVVIGKFRTDIQEWANSNGNLVRPSRWFPLEEKSNNDLDRDIRWRPIEEAPKDGTEVLGWASRYGHSFITYEPDCYAFTNRNSDVFPATHFCPLTPPDSKGGGV